MNPNQNFFRKIDKFIDWLKSTSGISAIEGFQFNGVPIFKAILLEKKEKKERYDEIKTSFEWWSISLLISLSFYGCSTSLSTITHPHIQYYIYQVVMWVMYIKLTEPFFDRKYAWLSLQIIILIKCKERFWSDVSGA